MIKAMIYTAQLICHQATVSKPKKVDFLDPVNNPEHEGVIGKESVQKNQEQLKPSLKKGPSVEKPSLSHKNS